MISFKGRQFQQDLILMAIRWYVAYALSYRDIEELMQERGVPVDHSTLNRWVVYYAPLLEAEFRKKHKRQVGVAGVWMKPKSKSKVFGIICTVLSIKTETRLISRYLKIVIKLQRKHFL